MFDKELYRRWWKIFTNLYPFALKHKSFFIKGMFAAVFVVAIRLILPWPFKTIIAPWFSGDAKPGVNIGINSILLVGGLFFTLFFTLGFCDFLQRLCFARFAIATVRDIRAKTLRQVLQKNPKMLDAQCGNVISCLIGDTARMKAGLKGFFVHVTTNGLILCGGSVILLLRNLQLGLIFTLGTLAIGLVTIWGMTYLFIISSKYRDKEGQLADHIYNAWSGKGTTQVFSRINYSSGKHEAMATKIQGMATCCTYGIFGFMVFLTLFIGVQQVEAGSLQAEELLLFILYSLIMRTPFVQLTRQGTRMGKIFACANRLQKLVESELQGIIKHLQPLQKSLRLIDIKVATKKSPRKHSRQTAAIHLEIPAGKHIAVVGKVGSGKTTLLEIIAGECRIKKGKIIWDDIDFKDIHPFNLSQQITYLAHRPNFSQQKIRKLFTTGNQAIKILKLCGIKNIDKQFQEGLETTVGADDLSFNECRALAITHSILANSSVLLLDDPFKGMKKKNIKKIIKKMLLLNKANTVIVTFSNPPTSISCFDYVIKMRSGRIGFMGTIEEWQKEQINTLL